MIIKKRYFNNFELSNKNHNLTKTSKDTEKLVNEINWYLKIPKNLKKYTPLIKDYSTKKDKPFLKMKYYTYPLLANLYIEDKLELIRWQSIFESLYQIQREMSQSRINITNDQKKKYINSIYVIKTLKRLKELQKDSRFRIFFDEEIIINSKRYLPLKKYITNLEQICNKILFKNIPDFRVIHGDFILANILMDLKTKDVKLVDPRGSFGRRTIYGDPRYELGKLLHSLNGHYEFIINDEFKITTNRNVIPYEIPITKRQQEISDLFIETSIKQKTLREEIELIEALLFLSMIPLHADFYTRQVVMLAQGVKKFHKFFKK